MKVLLHLIVLALLQITFSCCYSNTELKGGETATHRHIKYYSGLYSFDLIDDTLYYVREKVCHNQAIQTIPVTSADLRIIDSLASSIDYATSMAQAKQICMKMRLSLMEKRCIIHVSNCDLGLTRGIYRQI